MQQIRKILGRMNSSSQNVICNYSVSFQFRLMKHDDDLLRKLHALNESISGLKDIVKQKVPCRYCNTLDSVHSPDDGVAESEISSSHCSTTPSTEPIETGDVKPPTCNSILHLQTTPKIGPVLSNPISRVLTWLGNSDFDNAVDCENEVTFFRPRSKTCDIHGTRNSAFLSKRSLWTHKHTYGRFSKTDHVDCLGNRVRILKAPEYKTFTERDLESNKMWKSETSLSTFATGQFDPLVHWERTTPTWHSFSRLDKLDNYLLNSVGGRLRFQPRPRLHRQSSFSRSFDVTFTGGSVKIFLSESESPRSGRDPIVVSPVNPDIGQGDGLRRPVGKSGSVSELHKSDSGFDDSYDDIDRDTERHNPVKVTQEVRRNNEEHPSQQCGIEKTESETRDASSDLVNVDQEQYSESEGAEKINCQISSDQDAHSHAGENVTSGVSVDIYCETLKNDEVDINDGIDFTHDDDKHFITIHDGVVSCRIMTPNLERQISEQNEQEEDFKFLTITDGRVVFRSRETVSENEDELYNISELFEGYSDVGSDSTNAESYCTAVTEFSEQQDNLNPEVTDKTDTSPEHMSYCLADLLTESYFIDETDTSQSGVVVCDLDTR